MADMKDLANFLDSFVEPIQRIASQKTKETAEFVLTKLVEATPADTGAAISSWRVSLGSPTYEAVPPYVPSPKGRVKRGVWVHVIDPLITTGNNAPPTIAAGKTAMLSKRPGESIFISNNVEYIRELNQGSSLQAPAGFVDAATIAADQFVSQEGDIFGTRFSESVK